MSEVSTGTIDGSEVIDRKLEIAKVNTADIPETVGPVETNKGRIIESDDLLFYTDRRGPGAFTKLLIEVGKRFLAHRTTAPFNLVIKK